jgi:hypothetical protein
VEERSNDQKTFMDLQTAMESVDLFANIKPPEELRELSRLHWLRMPWGYLLQVKGERNCFAKLSDDAIGHWHLTLTQDNQRREANMGGDLAFAVQTADAKVAKHWPQWIGGCMANSSWCNARPTDRQRDMLRKHGYADRAIDMITKSDAGAIITQIMMRRGRHTVLETLRERRRIINENKAVANWCQRKIAAIDADIGQYEPIRLWCSDHAYRAHYEHMQGYPLKMYRRLGPIAQGSFHELEIKIQEMAGRR